MAEDARDARGARDRDDRAAGDPAAEPAPASSPIPATTPMTSPPEMPTAEPLIAAEPALPASEVRQVPGDAVPAPPTEASTNETPTSAAPFPPPTPQPTQTEVATPERSWRAPLVSALEKIRFRKRAKLEKIVALAAKKRSISNDDVQMLVHVSDATATRYLSQLVREGRLKRLGAQKRPRYEPA